jgi:hypothetical protein
MTEIKSVDSFFTGTTDEIKRCFYSDDGKKIIIYTKSIVLVHTADRLENRTQFNTDYFDFSLLIDE